MLRPIVTRWGTVRSPATRLATLLSAALLLFVGCSRERAPVVVIGFDGADFDLLLPWMEKGELPHLRSFLDDAAVGELTTVFPILSPVAWTSAATGVNPGKHGIYDFQKEDPSGGPPLIETATSRRALPIWMLLDDRGYRVGIMNVPMTYPPDPVHGAMISGFPFPSGEVNITYPPTLQTELGDYPVDHLGLSLGTRSLREMYEEFIHAQEARGRVALDWVRSGTYDFLWIVFTGTDKVQHFFWKYMDPNHPQYDATAAKEFGGAILELWRRQDQILGDLLAELPDDATVVLLSDHGFEALWRQVNLDRWLPQTRLGKWLEENAAPPLMITNGIVHYVVQGLHGRESNRNELLDQLLALCRELRDPETGVAPFERIFRREDIYSGRMLDKAPDVVFQDAPKYIVIRGGTDSDDSTVFEEVRSTTFSAHHRPEGILAMRGPAVKASTHGLLRERLRVGGDFDRAHIQDVAPTLLALLGEVVPDEMDGRVLEESIKIPFLAKHPVQIEPVEGFLLDRLPASPVSEDEKSKLRALPYIR